MCVKKKKKREERRRRRKYYINIKLNDVERNPVSFVVRARVSE